MKKLLGLLILLLACGDFDEEKAREEILNLIEIQDKKWFEISFENGDTAIIDTIIDSTGIVIRWWREVEEMKRGDSIFFEEDTAFVDITDTLSGRFVFYLADTSLSDTTRYEKTLKEVVKRSAIYLREEDEWRLLSVSSAEGVSDTLMAPLANLLWIKIAEDTLTPDILISPDSIYTFHKGESINLLLKTTLDTTEAVAVLYTGERERFIPQGEDKDLWSLVWRVNQSSGMYRMVIYTINRKIFFEEWPYDTNFWIISYKVE